MSLDSIVNASIPKKILSIDPASHSLAWSVLSLQKDKVTVLDVGKIDFSKEKNITEKFDIIRNELSHVCQKHKPQNIIIEQSVYIQNFQSSRIISYIIGFSWGVGSQFCDSVQDVNPLVWKSGIGYRNVSKLDQKQIEIEHGPKNLQTRLKNERKDRVKIIIKKYLDYVSEDSDINDALGIGLWFAANQKIVTIVK